MTDIMKKIVLATHNNFKTKEFASWLSANYPNTFELATLASLKLPEPEENGSTFAENAFLKAKAAHDATGFIAVADDSGLCVEALEGRPGVYSARYAGEKCTSDQCITKLLKELGDTPMENRKAKFVCALCMVLPDGRRIEATGEVDGVIITKRMGSGRFGYDPVFWYPPLCRTFADISTEVKNGISHRGKALADLKDKIEKLGGVSLLTD